MVLDNIVSKICLRFLYHNHTFAAMLLKLKSCYCFALFCPGEHNHVDQTSASYFYLHPHISVEINCSLHLNNLGILQSSLFIHIILFIK